jgi:hypothetical protein
VFIFSLPFELQKTVRALPQVHGVEGGRKLSQLMREKNSWSHRSFSKHTFWKLNNPKNEKIHVGLTLPLLECVRYIFLKKE